MSDLLQAINAAVPAGYRAVGYWKPKAGDRYLNLRNEVLVASLDFTTERYIILERDIQWPDWIKSGTWVALCNNGSWCVADSEPILKPNFWMFGLKATCLHPDMFDISWLPTNIDWKESKRQKP